MVAWVRAAGAGIGTAREVSMPRRSVNRNGSSPLVLLAEDDEVLAGLISHDLREAGFRICWARDGVTAINEIMERKPAVILLDLGLPRLPGQNICAMVRRSPMVGQTPIVVISGAGERDTKLTLFDSGADDFIVKPFAIDELTARVQAAWERAQTSGCARATLSA